MDTVYKRVELLANIAIIVAALAICGLLVKRYAFGSDGPTAVKELQVGESVSLPDVNWAANRRTLLLVLSRGCHFCSDSAPFYRRLARQASDKGVGLIAVFPHEVEEGRRYLNELEVPIADLRQAPLKRLKVMGTPMLILVNDAGVVEGTWIGQLPPDKEAEVFSRL